MKHFLTIAAICCCMGMAQSGFAQFGKGNIVLGGYLSFGYSNNNTTQNSLNISPSVGYVIKDNLTTFLNLGYYAAASNYVSNNVYTNNNIRLLEQRSSSFSTSIGIERLWKIGGNFGFALRGDIEAFPSSSKRKLLYTNPITGVSQEREEKDESLSLGISATPNLTYQIGDRFNLRLSLGNIGIRNTNSTQHYTDGNGVVHDVSGDTNSFFGNFSLASITLGAYYIIQPKKQKAE